MTFSFILPRYVTKFLYTVTIFNSEVDAKNKVLDKLIARYYYAYVLLAEGP